MGINEIHARDAVDQPSGEAHGNITAQSSTQGNLRGNHVNEMPITAAKEITPASNTDVDFAHRYVYAEGAGDVTVRFESGGTAYAIAFPDNGILPMRVYSIDAYGGSGSIWLFG